MVKRANNCGDASKTPTITVDKNVKIVGWRWFGYTQQQLQMFIIMHEVVVLFCGPIWKVIAKQLLQRLEEVLSQNYPPIIPFLVTRAKVLNPVRFCATSLRVLVANIVLDGIPDST